MALSIKRSAKEAEQMSAVLQVFLDNLPDETELSDSMEDMISLADYLQSLDQDYGRVLRRSQQSVDDLDLLLSSVDMTMERMRDAFRETRFRRHDGSRPYRRAWEDLTGVFRDEERGPRLGARMEVYSMFAKGMLDCCQGVRMQPGELQSHREWIARCLRRQEQTGSETSSLNDSFAGMSFGHRPPAGMPSMPPLFRASTQTSPPRRPPMGGRPTSFPAAFARAGVFPAGFSPPYPTNSHVHPPPGGLAEWWDEWDVSSPPPPMAPDPPNPYPVSPTSSDASGYSGFTWSSNNSARPPPAARMPSRTDAAPHWATEIFDGRHPTTYYQKRLTRPAIECFGRPEPGTLARLHKESFQEVLRLSFEATDTTLRLFWRPDNKRARIHISSQTSYTESQSCLPLTALKLVRKENTLQLNRLNRQTGALERWANVTFDVYERLVLFYCAFAAMKSQDDKPHPEVLADYFYTTNTGADEQIRFAGVIRDQDYLHALRVLEDRECGGLRLEARPCRGPMKMVPIWTAFCSTGVMRGGWVRRVGETRVVCRKVRVYCFVGEYVPLGGSGSGPGDGIGGDIRLDFQSREDCTSFLRVVEELRGE